MKQIKVVVLEKLVVGHWELIPIEFWYKFLALQDTAAVRVSEEIREEKKQRNYWWTEAKWPRLKEDLENSRYPYLRG